MHKPLVIGNGEDGLMTLSPTISNRRSGSFEQSICSFNCEYHQQYPSPSELYLRFSAARIALAYADHDAVTGLNVRLQASLVATTIPSAFCLLIFVHPNS